LLPEVKIKALRRGITNALRSPRFYTSQISFGKGFESFLRLRAEVDWSGGVARVAAHLPCWSENRVIPHPTTAPTDPSPPAQLIA